MIPVAEVVEKLNNLRTDWPGQLEEFYFWAETLATILDGKETLTPADFFIAGIHTIEDYHHVEPLNNKMIYAAKWTMMLIAKKISEQDEAFFDRFMEKSESFNTARWVVKISAENNTDV